MLCDYGCGQKSIKTFKNGKHCCSDIPTKCPEVRRKNKIGIKKLHDSGVKYNFYKKKIKCKYCNNFFSIGNLSRHIIACVKNPSNKCPVCGKPKTDYKNITCSNKCRLVYFGPPNKLKIENSTNYRTIGLYYHDKKCIICGEDNIVSIHHIDENHDNNEICNLCPLCPTHHNYMHSQFKYLIEKKVHMFVLKQCKHMWE